MWEESAGGTGGPCWLSLATTDLRAAERFYGAVLGWSFRPASFGRAFSVAELDGVPIGGIGAVAGQFAVPVAWTPYFSVENATEAVARVRERGGTVGVGPVSFPLRGRAALVADREGAAFGLWEGGVLTDWLVGNLAPAWIELHTADAFDAALFYGEVLRWLDEEEAGSLGVSYEEDQVVLRHQGQAVARLNSGPVEAGSPQPVRRPRWLVNFRVPSVERAVGEALELGAEIMEDSGSLDSRRVTLRDPGGALFTVDSHLDARTA
ncbi:VOC family protein [Streptomyces sp. NPDC091268]|uniref:VOC family protein n=1 Tax=Streptomyces sp. NPDC091268 TaxID=3365979 RepID=UPI00382DD11E